MHPGNPA